MIIEFLVGFYTNFVYKNFTLAIHVYIYIIRKITRYKNESKQNRCDGFFFLF